MINRIMYMSEAVMEADEAIGRLDEILSQQPMPEPETQKRPVNAAVAFDHVTFTYPGADRPALEDVSFSVQPGEVVALVGPSGGGKTTAASLIPRFWDVDSGSVTVGGADVRELDSAALMGQVAFVFQDTRLFKESLLENIRAARPDASGRRCLPPPMPPSAMTSWKSCPRGWTRWWVPGVSTSPAGNSSALPWPGPF